MSQVQIVCADDIPPAPSAVRKKSIGKRLMLPALILVGGVSQLAWIGFLGWAVAWALGLA